MSNGGGPLASLEAGVAQTEEIFSALVAVAERRGVAFVSVVLDCEPEENVRRMRAPGRAEQHKVTDADSVLAYRETHEIAQRDVADRFRLDVTTLSAEEAAQRIVEMVRGVSPRPVGA